MLRCPINHEELEKAELTQGDVSLGFLWICPFTEWGKKKGNCDYTLDTDDEGNPILEDEDAII